MLPVVCNQIRTMHEQPGGVTLRGWQHKMIFCMPSCVVRLTKMVVV
jgi:hypothetical protein